MAGTGAFPVSAQEVIDDARFRHVFTSKATGIDYYVRPMDEAERKFIPDNNIVEDADGSTVFVAVKDDRIVEAPLEDRIALLYILAGEMAIVEGH